LLAGWSSGCSIRTSSVQQRLSDAVVYDPTAAAAAAAAAATIEVTRMRAARIAASEQLQS